MTKDGFGKISNKDIFNNSIASNTVMSGASASTTLEPELSLGVFVLLVYSKYQTAIKRYAVAI